MFLVEKSDIDSFDAEPPVDDTDLHPTINRKSSRNLLPGKKTVKYKISISCIMVLSWPGNWVFHKCFRWIQWQNICHYCKRAQTCHSATPCVRDQDATTALARHMWETGSLNWVQFKLQWFSRFPEFAEFTELLFHLGKTHNVKPKIPKM